MNKNNQWKISFDTLKLPLIFIIVFYSIAIWRFLATGKIFYIYNFVYIGTSIAFGIFLQDALPKIYISWGRRISQILIGTYMIGYVGIIHYENMQLEGFFFYLLNGLFAGATLHYFLAKIVGVAILNRGWCSWACWTTMILDILPWKKSKGRYKKFGIIRYLHFFLSFSLVFYFWFVIKQQNIYNKQITEIYWLATGNAIYYTIAIILAVILKDNRAFCKYVCPIPTFQKIFSRFALLKVKIDNDKCTECGLCEKNCPMNIKLLDYKRKNERILSTECIMCSTCSNVCPHEAVKFTFGFDCGKLKEKIKYIESEPVRAKSINRMADLIEKQTK